MKFRLLSAACAVMLTILVASPAAGQRPPVPQLVGYVSHEWAADEAAMCVPHVDRALSKVRSHGDRLGFHLGETRDLSRFGRHWQGVQRLSSGGGTHLVLSRSGNEIALVVVRLDSRASDGMRFRSNRLDPTSGAMGATPPEIDRVVAEVRAEPGFDHAGGMQAIGSVLAVPYEDHRASSRVVLYDVRDPARPARLHVLDRSDVRPPSNPGQASSTGIAKLADGRYLLVVGVKSSKILDFYVSTTTSLRDPALRFVWFHTRSGGLVGGFQSLNFVTQCDGTLFLVGTHNTSLPPPQLGDDHVHWYRVSLSGSTVSLEQVGERHAYCHACNFAAAAGVYTDPAGAVMVYAVEHEDGGPLGTVRFEEFRPSRAAAAQIGDAWVELFEDRHFGGHGLILDYADRALAQHDRLDAGRFAGRASAVRWSLPAGWRARLYEHTEPCGGRYLDLRGTGERSDLDAVGLDDATSCVVWLPDQGVTTDTEQ